MDQFRHVGCDPDMTHCTRSKSELPVRIPGRMPGACVLHASVPVISSHMQPLYGGDATTHRSSSIHRIPHRVTYPDYPHQHSGVARDKVDECERFFGWLRSESNALCSNCSPISSFLSYTGSKTNPVSQAARLQVADAMVSGIEWEVYHLALFR